MIKAIQKHLNNRKGFTLIELIVVIVILGILAAILVPTFNGYANKARKSSDDALIANVKTALAVAFTQDETTPVVPANWNLKLQKLATGVTETIDKTTVGASGSLAIAAVEKAFSNTDTKTFKLGYYDTVTYTIDGNGKITVVTDPLT